MATTRRVILMIETSRAYGRGCLLGIAGYIRAHRSWQVLHLERGLAEGVPAAARQWGGDGVIARIENSRTANAIARLRLPTVDLRGEHHLPGAAMFDTDPDASATLALDHFLTRGFRHLAYCGYDGLGFSDRRGDAFDRQARAQGYVPHRFGGKRTRASRDTLRREAAGELDDAAMAAWLANLPRPIGVFACNDVRGRQVLGACARAKLAVPDEVAVLGVDDDPVLCEMANPPLSSIEPNTYRLGYEGAATLDAMMNGAAPPSQTQLVAPRRLATRRSTDVVAVEDPDTAAALRFIRDHATERIGVDDVLRHVSISRSTLERRFQTMVSRSPGQEIERVRLQRVCQLLAETDYRLAQIAERTGYANAAHLAAAFKKHTRQTPGSYRRAAAPNAGNAR